MTTPFLQTGTSYNQLNGGVSSGNLLGGIGSLLSGLVGATGGGGTLTGGAATDGSVAPQYYSGGLFGIGAKEIPGLTAAPKNVTYADSVQGYALNPPNIPSAAPLALSPMGTPNIILPGYASHGGGVSAGGGGYAVPTVAALPGVPGGSAPGAAPLQVAQQQGAPQVVSGGEGAAMPGSPGQPLQGYVSNQPQAPGQAPWMGQIGQLAQGAANFAGQLFGGQPAMAANPQGRGNYLVPPPPPMTPSMLAPPQQAQRDPANDALVYGQVPSQQSMSQAVQHAASVANQLGQQIAQSVLGANGPYASLEGIRRDLDRGMKQLAGGLKTVNAQLRKPYQDAAKTRFDTPIANLGGLTLNQYRQSLEGRIENLNQQIHDAAGSQVTLDEVDSAERSISESQRGIAALYRAAAQPTTARSGPYGLFHTTHPGVQLGEQMAQNAMNPVAIRQTAVNMATAAHNARVDRAIGQLRDEREGYLQQRAYIDKEYHAYNAEKAAAETEIRQMNKDALDAYYQQAQAQLKAFGDAGNIAAQAMQAELANKRADLAQETQTNIYNEAVQRNNRESAAVAAKLNAEAAKVEGEMTLKAAETQIKGLNALSEFAKKTSDLSKEEKAKLLEMLPGLLNQQQNQALPVAGKPNAGPR